MDKILGKKGIVFDLDGTVIDSLGVTLEAFNRGFEAAGAPRLDPVEIMQHFGPGERDIFIKVVGAQKADHAYQVSRKYTDDNLTKVPFFSGMLELIEQLTANQIPVAIFTGRGRDTTDLILNHHNVTHLFTSIITHDEVDFPKPAAEGLLKSAQAMKLAAHEVIMVGDSWADIQAAGSAGSLSIAAAWDLLANEAHLLKQRPTHLVRSVAELRTLLNLGE